MKKLIAVLLSTMLGSVYAASQDTLAQVRDKVVELHITHKPEVQALSKLSKPRIENMGHSICSGAFVDGMGDIITARHCADNIQAIEVVDSDGREWAARVVALSDNHDLALIHIDRVNSPYFKLAKTLQQGQTVYAYGSPLGITGTLAAGIIAKLGGDVNYVDLSVLPGNSGGPLFNEDGELVGITTAGFIVLYGTTHLNIVQSVEAILFFAMSIK